MRLLGSGLVLGSGCTRTMIVTDFIISMIQLPAVPVLRLHLQDV